MSEFTKEMLEHFMTLSRVTVPEEKQDQFLVDMQSIVAYVSKVQEVADKSAMQQEKMGRFHTINVMRADNEAYTPKQFTNKVLAIAPERGGENDEFIKVKNVLPSSE